ncbi:mitochondrial processing peptidase [Citrus sinensis]|uniref:Mitochondrial processing peptidase n=1 Tax=Citrus sinensis TaxID=2711 RepID=A0ACB8J993_CITSI|nr:mitochondrial processing peptidase [Citrus sinensis]
MRETEKRIAGHMRCRMPATARFASSSAVASTSSSSGGFYSWLSGEQSTSSPSLDFPLPGICLSHPSSLPDYFYVDCGSIYESPISFVKTDLLEHMAFRSTRDRSHLPSPSREQMGCSFAALETYVPEMVELLTDISEATRNPQSLLSEAIFSACYSVVLANPLLAPECAISRLNSTLIKEFFAENYTAPWMVLAASGVEHDQLVSVEEPLLSDLPISILTKSPDLCTLEVITAMLLEGGGSFSAGGPGKGIPRVQCFSGTTGYDSVPKSIDLAGREFTSLDRAVQSTNSAILMNLESRIVVSEDIDRQVQTHGEMKPKLILSPLTMASYGDVINVPSYDAESAASSSQNRN